MAHKLSALRPARFPRFPAAPKRHDPNHLVHLFRAIWGPRGMPHRARRILQGPLGDVASSPSWECLSLTGRPGAELGGEVITPKRNHVGVTPCLGIRRTVWRRHWHTVGGQTVLQKGGGNHGCIPADGITYMISEWRIQASGEFSPPRVFSPHHASSFPSLPHFYYNKLWAARQKKPESFWHSRLFKTTKSSTFLRQQDCTMFQSQHFAVAALVDMHDAMFQPTHAV